MNEWAEEVERNRTRDEHHISASIKEVLGKVEAPSLDGSSATTSATAPPDITQLAEEPA